MKPLFTACLFLLAFAGHAQQPASRRFSFGLQTSLDNSYRYLDGDPQIVRVANDLQVPMLGYRVGAAVRYALGPHWALEAGLLYASRGYQTKWLKASYPAPSPDPDLPEQFLLRYTHYYIDVPLRANYAFGPARFQWVASAGLAANYFVLNWTEARLDFGDRIERQTQNTSESGFNRISISPEASFGLQCRFRERGPLFRLAPAARYMLFDGTNQDLWSVGLEAGVFF